MVREHYLKRGRLENLVMNRGEDQSWFHALVAPHVVATESINSGKIMQMA